MEILLIFGVFGQQKRSQILERQKKSKNGVSLEGYLKKQSQYLPAKNATRP